MLKKIVQLLALVAALFVGSLSAFAGGSSPGLYYGQIPTAAQWNSYFSAKLDYTPGAANTIPYWDGNGSMLNALISGDCTSAANVFTCTASHAVSISGGTQWGVLYQSASGVTASTSAGTAGQVLTSNGTSAPTFQSPASALTSDNPIINGEMLVDQANSGAAVTVNATASFYSVDMWTGIGTPAAGVFTLQQLNSATGPSGFKNYLRITTTTADAAPVATAPYVVEHRIEGFNWARFSFGTAGAKTITLPMWVRSSVTGTFSGSIKNGSTTRSYPFIYTISAANTWTQVAITITGDTTGTWAADNTIGATITFDVGSGSSLQGTAGAWAAGNFVAVTGSTKLISTLNATLDITGVDVVEGSVSRPYPHLTYDKILAQCQRYLPVVYGEETALDGMVLSTTSSLFGYYPKVTPRITPTGVTAVGSWVIGTAAASGGVTGFSVASLGIGIYVNATTTAGSPTIAANNAVLLAGQTAGSRLLLTGARL